VENKDGTRLSVPAKKGKNVINRNVAVFAFFLFLSFVFWYLNSLGDALEAEIRYPVHFVNLPKERTLSGELPSRLSLNLTGPGYSILRLKVSGNKAPLEIDFSRISIINNQGGSSSGFYIISSGLVQNFNSQLKSECKVVSVRPDTLYFSFSLSNKEKP